MSGTHSTLLSLRDSSVKYKLLEALDRYDEQILEAGGGSTELLKVAGDALQQGLAVSSSRIKKQQSLRKSFEKNFIRIATKLEKKKISGAEFMADAEQLLWRHLTRAWNQGAKSVDPDTQILDTDFERIRSTVQQQLHFARNMMDNIIRKDTVMPIERRAAMYAHALDGSFEEAAVSRMKGVLIYWRLTDAEHCPTCIDLANGSPYTPDTLPTTPRKGETQCLTNCKCFLEITTKEKNTENFRKRVIRATAAKGGIRFGLK